MCHMSLMDRLSWRSCRNALAWTFRLILHIKIIRRCVDGKVFYFKLEDARYCGFINDEKYSPFKGYGLVLNKMQAILLFIIRDVYP